MIATSKVMQLAAGSAALAAHAVLALALVGDASPARIEGSGGPQTEVRLGNAFADMAAGTLSPETGTAPIQRLRPEAGAPATDTGRSRPRTAEAAVPAKRANPSSHAPRSGTAHRTNDQTSPGEAASPLSATHAAVPVAPRPAEAEAPAPAGRKPARKADAVRAVPVSPATEATPSAPAGPTSGQRAQAVTTAAPAPAARLEPAAAQQPEILSGTDPDAPRLTRTRRPEPRSAEFVARHKPAAQASTRGSTSPATRAGAPTGNQAARARANAGNGQSQAAGTSAADDYPGHVLRQLSRVPKPGVRAGGTAVIAFRIGAGGGLAAISVARSSGSARLDQAALQVVRNAAPFPPPPSGARRDFSIRIEGR